MDKELIFKRIEVLDEIDLLKEKCKCTRFDVNCSNCVAINKLGDKLLKLTDKKGNKVTFLKKEERTEEERNGVKKLEKFLTADKYIEFKKEKLTDLEIAEMYKVNTKAVLIFKNKYDIRVKKSCRRRTEKELKKIKKIINKEKDKIAKN